MALGILLAAVSAGCGPRNATTPPPPGGRTPLLVVAVDALEWSELLPRFERGELPVLAALVRSGPRGYLRSMVPSVSPVIWTTVATGRAPDDHGIQGFAKTEVAGGPPTKLFNAYDRRRKAFWNILGERGRRVGVVGWWMTYPADSVNGVMVAQVNTLEALGVGGSLPLMGGLAEGLPGQVFPPSEERALMAIGARVATELDTRMAAIFGDAPGRTDGRERVLWDETSWAVRADATYLGIVHALDPASFDVLAVYLGGIDVIGHRFWRYAHPGDFEHPPAAREEALFGAVVGDYCAAVDREIGRLLARYPTPPDVIVLSDHGMHAVNREHVWADGDVAPLSGHHDDGPPGVVILSGPDFAPARDAAPPAEPGDLPTLGSILDVLPTMLAVEGLPDALDLAGRPWTETLVAADRPPPIPTYEDDAWTRARAALDPDLVADPGESERFEQLRSLGYLH